MMARVNSAICPSLSTSLPCRSSKKGEGSINSDTTIRLVFCGENHANIRDHIDFGPLVAEFTSPLEGWGLKSYVGGRARIGFERTHEWEAILTITLVGAGAFGGAFCAELGKKLAGAVFDWGRERLRAASVGGSGVDDHVQERSEVSEPQIEFDNACSAQQMADRLEILSIHPGKVNTRIIVIRLK